MIHEVVYVATVALVAFANCVVAGSKNPTPTKSTSTRTLVQTTSEASGRECYRKGVKTRCPVTTTTAETTWRTIGIIIGVIVFLLIVYVCVIFHKEIKAFFSRMRITKGVNQQASPRAGTIPLYHDKGTSADPHQKEGGVVAESEVHPPKVATSTQARANSLTATPVAPARP